MTTLSNSPFDPGVYSPTYPEIVARSLLLISMYSVPFTQTLAFVPMMLTASTLTSKGFSVGLEDCTCVEFCCQFLIIESSTIPPILISA